tara:strand:+ start:373 stop:507 length:135 start_codon:yes stop_codon:yes gene_type:complete
MNFSTILIITLIATLAFYMIFLVIGLGGISQNRKAQGLDHKPRK